MRGRAVVVAVAIGTFFPDNASAASLPMAVPVGDIFGIGKALLGGLEITADFFKDMFLALFGGLADMLVPDSWADKGREMLIWIASVPDYTRPAFGGLHAVSEISLWLGLAILPVTLSVTLFMPSLGLTSASDSPGAVIGRTLGAAAGMVLWNTIWSQGAALCNSISASYVLSDAAADAMNAYMELIAVGGLLGGIQILGILIVLVAALLFLSGLVMKVVLLLFGGVLFGLGMALLGLAPTERGARLGRSWVTALLMTWTLPIMWGVVLVVSGIFIDDAKAIGVAIGGRGSIASTGGTIVAGCAAIAGPLLCMSLTRSLLGPLGSQFVDAASKVSPGKLMHQVMSAPGTARGGPRKAGATRAVASPLNRGTVGGIRERLMQDRRRAGQAARADGGTGRNAAAGSWARGAPGFASEGATAAQANGVAKAGETNGRAARSDSGSRGEFSAPLEGKQMDKQHSPTTSRRAERSPRRKSPEEQRSQMPPRERPIADGGSEQGQGRQHRKKSSPTPPTDAPRRGTTPGSRARPAPNPDAGGSRRAEQSRSDPARRARRRSERGRPRPKGDDR